MSFSDIQHSPVYKHHPNTIAAFKARIESVVNHKRVLTPAETQCYASKSTNPMYARLAQLAVPSPQRLETLPTRLRSASRGSETKDSLRDRMGSIEYRRLATSGGEKPFDMSDTKEASLLQANLATARATSDSPIINPIKTKAKMEKTERDARMLISKNAKEEEMIAKEQYVSALTPSRYCRISPSPNSFMNLPTEEKKERLRVVQPEARKYICTLRNRLSVTKVSSPLAYAVYGTAINDPEVWAPKTSEEGEGHQQRAGGNLTTEDQIKSILRNEKRKTANTISHEHYAILRNLFEEIDEDGSGYLELKELIQFRAQFPKRLPENVLHMLKLEQDGRVYLDDFLSTFYPCVSQSGLEQLMSAFEPKAKDLTTVSTSALQQLNAHYNLLRHTYWDFTLEKYAHEEGPFDQQGEYQQQIARGIRRRRSTKGERMVDDLVEHLETHAGQIDPMLYHLHFYKRHHRHCHEKHCPYLAHTATTGDGDIPQMAMLQSTSSANDSPFSALTSDALSMLQRSYPQGSQSYNNTAKTGSDGASDASASSCSCGGDLHDHTLNAYQWYLHEARVLSQSQGDSSIGAFVTKLRVRDVPLKASIPGHLRLLLSANNSNAVRQSNVTPTRNLSLGKSVAFTTLRLMSLQRRSKGSSDNSSELGSPDKERGGLTNSFVANSGPFQMTPFIDGDQSKPNIPFLLACPIGLKDFARVAMDYFVKQENNQPTYHYDAALAEKIEGLRWHKLFPYTGDVRHFFKHFSNESSDEESEGDGEAKIPQYIRRGGLRRVRKAMPSSANQPTKPIFRK